MNKSKTLIEAEDYARALVQRHLWTVIAAVSGMLAISLMINGLMGYALIFRFPVKQFLWTSDAGSVCEAVPLADPNISQARLKDLASTAAVQLHTFDYANWRVMINSTLEKFFTPHGRDDYRAAFASTGIIQRVVENYQVVSSATMGPANISDEGRKLGRYYWDVEVPLAIFYQTNTDTKKEMRMLTMTIVRVDPSPANPNGVAIDAVTSSQLLQSQLNRIAR